MNITRHGFCLKRNQKELKGKDNDRNVMIEKYEFGKVSLFNYAN